MASAEDKTGVTISVLDRLLDYEPEASREADLSRPKSLRQLKDAVRRDLEWLLNTRKQAGLAALDLKEIKQSVAAYGLPEFADLSPNRSDDQKQMRREIEETIRFFEPRLEAVVVSFQPPYSNERLMHFRIDAHLKVDPEPQPITFDTVVQAGNGQYVVREE
jgi:type VI secretion system protein ImpF